MLPMPSIPFFVHSTQLSSASYFPDGFAFFGFFASFLCDIPFAIYFCLMSNAFSIPLIKKSRLSGYF